MTTTLWQAAYRGNVEEINVLLAQGHAVNRENSWIETPLHLAAEQGHPEAVEALLRGGALVDARDKRRCTPLHRAVDSDTPNVEVVRRLLERGASLTVLNDDHETPLSIAESRDDLVLVSLLRGADDLVPCPLGTGRAILRRLEGLYKRNAEAEEARRVRLEMQATGAAYAEDAPSQSVPDLIRELRLKRHEEDDARLSVPMREWGAREVAEFIWKSVSAPIRLESTVDRQKAIDGEEKKDEYFEDGEEEEETSKKYLEGGEEEEETSKKYLEGGEEEKKTPKKYSLEGGKEKESNLGRSVLELENGKRRMSRPWVEVDALGWASLDVVGEDPLGGGWVLWWRWMERCGVTGMVLSQLTRHVSAGDAVSWMLQRAGVPAGVRKLAVPAIVSRAKADGSTEMAMEVMELPVGVADDADGGIVGAGGSMHIIGSVRVREQDRLLDVRHRLNMDRLFPMQDAAFVLGASARPVHQIHEERWNAMAAGYIVLLVQGHAKQQALLHTRPPTRTNPSKSSASSSIIKSLHPVQRTPIDLRSLMDVPCMAPESVPWAAPKRESASAAKTHLKALARQALQKHLVGEQ